MIESGLRLLLVALVWADALTTYLFLKKARDYGYPKWSEEETSPVYRYFVRKYGLLRGVLAVAFINPVVFFIFTWLVSRTLSIVLEYRLSLGLGYGIFYGMILISVHRNYFVYYRCPADRYNEKILGRPVDNGGRGLGAG
jgi:hypothetical protein